MSEQARVSSDSAAASVDVSTETEQINLGKRTRPVESVIQGILFFCGFVSIFTTLGIVYILLTESLNFFFFTEIPEEVTGGTNLGLMDQSRLAAWLPENLDDEQLAALGENLAPALQSSLSEEELSALETALDQPVSEASGAELLTAIDTAFVIRKDYLVDAIEAAFGEDQVAEVTGIDNLTLLTAEGIVADLQANLNSEQFATLQSEFVPILQEELTSEQISTIEENLGQPLTEASGEELIEMALTEFADKDELILDSVHNTFGERVVSVGEFINPVRTNDEGGLELAKWQPQIDEFSIWPLLNSTLMITTIALIVAVPLGLGTAIYLSEYATLRVRNVLKPILEILAGIPTVVYGFFAISFMTPVLQNIFGQGVVQIYNTASAGIVVGILILPMIASMTEDALSAVPRSLREGSYGLGATRFETATKIVFPAALSGVLAALIVAISRAVGETMIVAIAAGAGPNFTFNPFESAETMTGHIARISGGDISYQTVDYNSLFAIGLVLFIVTLTLNIISRKVVKRFREVYD